MGNFRVPEELRKFDDPEEGVKNVEEEPLEVPRVEVEDSEEEEDWEVVVLVRVSPLAGGK